MPGTGPRKRGRRPPPPQGWELTHSPLTVEGRIEGLGRLAAGVSRRRREGRDTWVDRVAVAMLVLPFLGGVASLLFFAAERLF